MFRFQVLCKNLIILVKFCIFWERHKILRNLRPSSYFCLQYIQTKVRWRFRKILWPSQNIWTLCNCKQAKIQDNLKVSFLSLVRISWTNESNFVHPKSNLHNRKHRHATLLIQISFDWKNKAASKITRQQQNYDSPKPTYLFIRVQREWVTPIFLPIKSLVVRFNNIYHRATDT